jgi:TRAP-type C4-dicarboxylate transport system permease small subunit
MSAPTPVAPAESVALLRAVQRLRAWVERLGRLMGCAAGWLFVVCAVFVTVDVISRKVFGFSSRGTVEITGYMLALGITWGLAHTLTLRAHIRVDVLVTRMPVGLRAYMHALALAFLTVMTFFFAWRGWAVFGESWEFGSTDTSALSIPLVLPQGLWALGLSVFFVLTVTLFLEVVLLLVLGRGERVDRLLGPRSVQEETAEVLEAAALVHSAPSAADGGSPGPRPMPSVKRPL